MKKSVLKIALLLSAATFLVSCASQKDIEDLRYQLRIVNKKISDMKADTVDPLQKRQAAASGQMDLLEQDLMQLKKLSIIEDIMLRRGTLRQLSFIHQYHGKR